MPARATAGVPSVLEANVQPARFTAKPLGLYSSIHSSAMEAPVPPHAISLMTTAPGVRGVAVAVAVGVGVAVSVGVGVSLGRGV